MAPAPDTPLGFIRFGAFDFETTGMDPLRDRIIEIGVTLFQRNEVLDSFHALVNPGIPIPREAFLVHGIGEDLLRGKPSLADVFPFFLNTIGGATLLAHNAPFDLSFLVEAAHQVGMAPNLDPIVDTCLLAKNLFPDFATHRLPHLAERFGFPAEGSHRALADARTCFLLFCRLVDELPKRWETSWGEFQKVASSVLWISTENGSLPEKLLPYAPEIQGRRRLLVSYRDGKGQVTRREITPMGILSDGQRPVLVGFCHLRQGTRTFRIDRILEIEKSL